jgi:chain length determinant protein (polysaccharide antigen chain regulator)
MKSRSIERESDVRPVHEYVGLPPDGRDEVSLIGVWRIIARRKAIILISLIAALLLAGIYLLIAKPVYRASAHLLPPQQQNIQALLVAYGGVEGQGLESYNPGYVYEAFLANLRSLGVRREFFDRHHLISHYVADNIGDNVDVDQVFDANFNKSLEIHIDEANPAFAVVSFIDRDPAQAAQVLNQIIDFANERTVNQLTSDIEAAIHAQIEKNRSHMDIKLKLAERKRLDTIAALREALRVAKALGIKEAIDFPKVADGSAVGLTVNTAQQPLYMRGSEALEMEISVLEARKSDAPFISGFRDLQEQNAMLEDIKIKPGDLSAVKVDVAARTPYRREKPSRLLVVLIAAMSGLGIGIVLAFFAESVADSDPG